MDRQIRNQEGAVAIMVALVLFVLCGTAALAIDIGHLMVVRNELRNASDAGTLAGARFLYSEDGRTINPGANLIAYNAATANKSENAAVEVNWIGGNSGDVQRGHWSFATRSFTPNDSLAALELWKYSESELDGNPAFINAVRVVTRRQSLPAASFFASIFGHEGFQLTAESVAYLGFAGSIFEGEADVPIAICEESFITGGGKTDCVTGRMLNSGSSQARHNTAGWTNFSTPCRTANASEMKELAACGTTNAATVIAGNDIGATGGVQSSTLSKLIDCWMSKADTDGDGIPDRTWDIGTVPVIECPGNNVSNCARMTGVVCATVVYMTGNNPDIEDVPYTMDDWDAAKDCKASSSSRSGADTRCKDKDKEHQDRWDCFVERFKLKDLDGAPARFESKTIYWLPGCAPCDRAGGTGGKNYGVLAKTPVLVK